MDDITTISELIDKLITINIKLYNVLEESAKISNQSKKTDKDMIQLGELNVRNINLVKNRSQLKSAIDQKIKDAIKSGNVSVLDEVKKYG
jgi:RNA processing factor Prp31